MNRAAIALLLLAVISLGTFTATGQAPIENRKTFLSALNEGQVVMLKDVAGRYEISTLEGVPGVLSHKVMEIGADHVVVQDITGIHEIHIPVYSIKAITHVKLPQK